MSLNAISLFSGAGGFDLGIHNAGFKILCAVEIDENCCETLSHNIKRKGHETDVICDDIKNVSPTKIKRDLNLKAGELDLLFGGPPCQSFSAIGKQEGINDHRGMLIFEMVRFARILKPKFVLMEQVAGFNNFPSPSGVRGGVRDSVVKEFHDLGYAVNYQVLNAADFGVPQTRKRFFLIAGRRGLSFEFPSPTHEKTTDLFSNNRWATVGDALEGLSSASPKGSDREDSHIDVTPEGDIRRITHVKEGECLAKSNAPIEAKGRLSAKDTTKFLRLSRNGQSNTLRCGEIFYHPLHNRYLTPREYMRIHSYPDDYVLRGPIRGRSGQVRNLDQHRQVANSVPPLLAYNLGLKIKKSLTPSVYVK